MPTIKHVGTHVDDLHDGRPIVPYASTEITTEDLALDHYQTRLAAGSLLLVPDEHLPIPEPSVNDTTEASEPDDALEDLKVSELRERAEAEGLDLPKSTTKPELIEALRLHATPQED